MDIYIGVRTKDELQELQNVRKVEHLVPAVSSPTQIPWQTEQQTEGERKRQTDRKRGGGRRKTERARDRGRILVLWNL